MPTAPEAQRPLPQADLTGAFARLVFLIACLVVVALGCHFDLDRDGLTTSEELGLARVLPMAEHRISTDPERRIGELHLGDLDGDGDIDALGLDYDTNPLGPNHLMWFENLHPEKSFAPSRVIEVGGAKFSRTTPLDLADIDGDGDLDLVASRTGGYLVIHQNVDGAGSFGPERIVFYPRSTVTAAVALDTDDDGDLDLIAGYKTAISHFENLDGLGSFSTPTAVSSGGEGLRDLALADLDGDGRQDLYSTTYSPGKIAWYRNRAGIGLGDEQIISLEHFANHSDAADVDNDGDLDLIVGTQFELLWLESVDAAQSFIRHPIADEPTTSLSAADVDLDGDLDFFHTGYLHAHGCWYENLDRRGDFAVFHPIADQLVNSRWSFGVDMDHDGYVDVVSQYDSYDGPTLRWHENPATNPLRWDTDRDGLGDGEEIDDFGTRPHVADTDGDGRSDGDEVQRGDSDPLDPDSDDDGLLDGLEVELLGTDPSRADSDGDGVSDGDEDPDGDGLTTYFEVAVLDLDPTNPDTDGDGVLDGDEDSDGDGLSDVEEVSVYATDPFNPDSDAEGLIDGDEVLLYGSDPLDVDTDEDGLTDFEEVQLGTNPARYDSDFDGLNDRLEVEVTGTDPNESDTDGDGYLDGDERNNLHSDPLDPNFPSGGPSGPDADGDGIDDLTEWLFVGTDPNEPDSDGDGFSDGEEFYILRTDPLNPASPGAL